MEIEYDNNKREKTLNQRGLDFNHSEQVFNGPHIDIPDTRVNYDEERVITFGFIDNSEVVIVWTQRGDKRRIISMRKANEHEKKAFY